MHNSLLETKLRNIAIRLSKIVEDMKGKFDKAYL